MSGLLTVPGGGQTTCERGTAGLLTVAAALLLLGTGTVAVVAVTDLALAAGRARTAADAAALAGMASSPLAGGDGLPHKPAVAAARANGAELLRADRTLWPLRLRVTVAADPATAAVRRIAGRPQATATAGVRPRAPVSDS